jgi:hypothetical protein
MTSIEAKEKLKKNGYTWFELSEFDPEFYNWLQPLKCNEEINLKDKITTLRMDMAKHPFILPKTSMASCHSMDHEITPIFC